MAQYVSEGYVTHRYYQTGVSINWGTKVINVPQFFLEYLGGNSYKLDTNLFRLALKDLEDDPDGIVFPRTHNHNTVVSLGGIEYARVLEIINGYTITFEETEIPYVVSLSGSNNNILEATNLGTVQILSNNSAGLININEVQHGIFGDAVHVDVVNGTSGTTYPVGTPIRPVNNIQDAIFIAIQRGFKNIHIIGNIILDAGDNVNDYTLVGENASRSHIIINADSDTSGTEIYESRVSGNLDGQTILRNCVLNTLNYVNGYVYNSLLDPGIITLGGAEPAYFLNCYSGNTSGDFPVIDLNGAGTETTVLIMRNYSGTIKLIDLTEGQDAIIDLSSGKVVIDSSCTGGSVTVRGDGNVCDELGNNLPSGVYNTNLTVINQTSGSSTASVDVNAIADAVWDESYIDHNTDGSMGHLINYIHRIEKKVWVNMDLPANGVGTQESPFNNITSAIDYCEAEGIQNIHLIGDIVLDRNFKNFTIHGVGVPEVDLNGFDCKGSHFHQVRVKGTYVNDIVVRDSLLLNNAYLNGFFENCVIQGTVNVVDSATVLLKDCGAYATGGSHITNIGTGPMNLSINGYKGSLLISGSDNAANIIDINVDPGEVTLDATNTAGTIAVRGFCSFTDNSNGATVIDNTTIVASGITGAVTPQDIADISDAVWNKLLADMLTAGSAGERLKALLTVNKYLGLQ